MSVGKVRLCTVSAGKVRTDEVKNNVHSVNLSIPRDNSALATLRRLYVIRDTCTLFKKKKKKDHTITQSSRRTEILTSE